MRDHHPRSKSLLLILAFAAVSCGPRGSSSQQLPGVVPNQSQPTELQDSGSGSAADGVQAQTAQRIENGEDEQRELGLKVDELRKQLSAAQADLDAISSSTQNEINQRTEVYASKDMQVQDQQLEIQIVRSQLANQVENQKNTVTQLQNLVTQEQAWGFDSPDLDANSAQLAQENQKLQQLQDQDWTLQQQSGAISALASESRAWNEDTDRAQLEQNTKQQYDAQAKRVQALTAQYNEAVQEQQSLGDSLDQLQAQAQGEPSPQGPASAPSLNPA